MYSSINEIKEEKNLINWMEFGVLFSLKIWTNNSNFSMAIKRKKIPFREIRVSK